MLAMTNIEKSISSSSFSLLPNSQIFSGLDLGCARRNYVLLLLLLFPQYIEIIRRSFRFGSSSLFSVHGYQWRDSVIVYWLLSELLEAEVDKVFVRMSPIRRK